MNGADEEKERAVAHIRRSTAAPIQRFLDIAVEQRLDRLPSRDGPPSPHPDAARRTRLGGGWSQPLRSATRWIARPLARLRTLARLL